MNAVVPAIMLFGFAVTSAAAAGDADRGARAFRQCAACHSTQPGDHRTGPSLAQVWNRKAATVPGFRRYSDALKGSKLTWDETTLDKWLANPEALVPGNGMTFGGLRQPQARQDVIAYLRAVSENNAPAQQAGGGMMGGMMGGGKMDLRKAPPEGQVKSVQYCGDTYTIATADGKAAKIWEFNLRLKTDSSELGPFPGKPVVIGAGMQGDRASLVFASPREIGEIVKSCP